MWLRYVVVTTTSFNSGQFSYRIALIAKGVHESKIFRRYHNTIPEVLSSSTPTQKTRFILQSNLVLWRMKSFVMRRDVLLNRFFTRRCETSEISQRLYRCQLEYEVDFKHVFGVGVG